MRDQKPTEKETKGVPRVHPVKVEQGGGTIVAANKKKLAKGDGPFKCGSFDLKGNMADLV